MIVNCSNHPSCNWSEAQIKCAEQWGEITDYGFPAIPATADSEKVCEIAKKVAEDIEAMKPDAVMCQGEFTAAYAIIEALLKKGIKVMAACSERVVVEEIKEDGTAVKNAVFKFQGFREYKKI